MPTPGKLTVYLGYAAGTGKTYRMLQDALRLRDSGKDVVIGYFEPHARPDTMALAQKLETVPRRELAYRNALFTEMDTDAVLVRAPAVCVVDELAHSNVPGSAREKRWQDVEWLRARGIAVLTTLNVQHLESLNDQMAQISGVRVRETVPDWVVTRADEVVMVDLTPGALLHRLERGVVYPPAQAERALRHFFQPAALAALRELALRQAAHATELRQPPAAAVADSGERILIHITADPATAMVIRRGRRVADFHRSACYAVHVRHPDAALSAAEAAAIERHLGFARDLRIDTRTLTGADIAAVLVDFARRQRIAQIFTSRSSVRGPLLERLLLHARDMQVTIVSQRG